MVQQCLARVRLGQTAQKARNLCVVAEVLQRNADEVGVATNLGLLGHGSGQAVVSRGLQNFDGRCGIILRHWRALEELVERRQVLQLRVTLEQQNGVLSLSQVLLVQSFQVLGYMGDPLCVEELLDDIRRLERQVEVDCFRVDCKRLVIGALGEQGVAVLAVDLRQCLFGRAALVRDLRGPIKHALVHKRVKLLAHGLFA
mmetsp:Transcript_51005/g.148507  ORF Transcript_51005/g.148507 Transcript_51005/m.148507 type:complete len:200 (-) Transcript_51005:630-1229(-)